MVVSTGMLVGGIGTFGRDYDNRNYNNEAFVFCW
jgi:hypothetical protein